MNVCPNFDLYPHTHLGLFRDVSIFLFEDETRLLSTFFSLSRILKNNSCSNSEPSGMAWLAIMMGMEAKWHKSNSLGVAN